MPILAVCRTYVQHTTVVCDLAPKSLCLSSWSVVRAQAQLYNTWFNKDCFVHWTTMHWSSLKWNIEVSDFWMPKRPATLDDQVWWIKVARSFFAFSLTSTTSSRLIKTQKSRPIFSRVEASHLVNNYAMPYFFVPRPWNADYRINHNCNKSFNDDWLSTFLNSALIGLYAWC